MQGRAGCSYLIRCPESARRGRRSRTRGGSGLRRPEGRGPDQFQSEVPSEGRSGGCEGNGEEALRILPDAGGLKTGFGEEAGYSADGELITVFGVNCVARVEGEVEVWAGEVGGYADLLGGEGIEAHLHAGLVRVPEGAMVEARGVEICAEIAIEAVEDVAVEGGGHSRGVVVGCDEGGDGLMGAGGKVGAEKEAITGTELGAKVGEEAGRFRRGEVADA